MSPLTTAIIFYNYFLAFPHFVYVFVSRWQYGKLILQTRTLRGLPLRAVTPPGGVLAPNRLVAKNRHSKREAWKIRIFQASQSLLPCYIEL